MSGLLDEDVLGTAAAARYLSERLRGARYSPAGIFRWMRNGVLADDGTRVYLEHARLGRRLITSRQALARFAARLATTGTPAGIADPATTEPKSDLEINGFFF